MYRNIFNFIISFRAFSVLPREVMLSMTIFLRCVFVERQDVWDACVLAFTSHSRTLLHSPLVLIRQQGPSTVITKTMVYSDPKGGVWGLQPPCTNPECDTRPGDVYSKTHKSHKAKDKLAHSKVSWACKRCHQKTNIVERPSWIEEVPDRRHYYVFEYPYDEKAEELYRSLIWS